MPSDLIPSEEKILNHLLVEKIGQRRARLNYVKTEWIPGQGFSL